MNTEELQFAVADLEIERFPTGSRRSRRFS